MKIQSSKPEASHQTLSTQQDAALSSSPSDVDLFSALISDMLSQGLMHQAIDEESEKPAENKQENEELETTVPVQTTTSSTTSSTISAIIEQSVLSTSIASSLPSEVKVEETANLVSNQDELHRLDAELNKSSLNESKLLTATTFTKTFPQEEKLAAEAEEGLREQLVTSGKSLQMNTLKPSINEKNSTLENILDNDIDSLNKLKKIVNPTIEGDIKTNKIVVKNTMLKQLDQTQTSTETLSMVFNSQKSLINYDVDEKNKYVDMLVQLGNMVVPQVAQSSHNMDEARLLNAYPKDQTYQAEKAGAKTQAEYELKIELFPESVKNLTKETYNASIKIYPPELGAILAKLKVVKNSAELIIMTGNDQIKKIVEANLVQLREHFREADIDLTSIQVNVQTSQQDASHHQDTHHRAYESASVREEHAPLNSAKTASKTVIENTHSLIDTYA
jgi:flagellar hook-length control protein FliK